MYHSPIHLRNTFGHEQFFASITVNRKHDLKLWPRHVHDKFPSLSSLRVDALDPHGSLHITLSGTLLQGDHLDIICRELPLERVSSATFNEFPVVRYANNRDAPVAAYERYIRALPSVQHLAVHGWHILWLRKVLLEAQAGHSSEGLPFPHLTSVFLLDIKMCLDWMDRRPFSNLEDVLLSDGVGPSGPRRLEYIFQTWQNRRGHPLDEVILKNSNCDGLDDARWMDSLQLGCPYKVL